MKSNEKGMKRLRVSLSRNNPHCDGPHCKDPNGEVRFLEYLTGGGKTATCHECFLHFTSFRQASKIPAWESLEVFKAPLAVADVVARLQELLMHTTACSCTTIEQDHALAIAVHMLQTEAAAGGVK